jgi:hypothetical protein
MKVCSDIVSDTSASDKYWFEHCAVTSSDNLGGNKSIPALLGSNQDPVEPASPAELPELKIRSNKSLILCIQAYIKLLSKFALISIAPAIVSWICVSLMRAALTWLPTRSLGMSVIWSLTIRAPINIALICRRRIDQTIPTAISVTD